MSSPGTVRADGIVLRELTREDLPRIRGWRASRELYAWLAGDYRPSSEQDEEAWFARYEANRGQERRFALCLRATGAHIGNVYLLGIDADERCAEFHIFIADPAQRGKGYGEAALRAALELAFGDLSLERVRLGVLAENAPARALYEKVGFRNLQSLPHRKDGAECTLLLMQLERASYAPR
jgi:RimJ/RimL family protein N-acetyltransferase